jgi:hypothetical protein
VCNAVQQLAHLPRRRSFVQVQFVAQLAADPLADEMLGHVACSLWLANAARAVGFQARTPGMIGVNQSSISC